MKLCHLLCALFAGLLITVCPTPTWAQHPAYEAFAVDSVATPRGGLPMLDAFLNANLQKPFMAKLANATGKVVVRAVVEPNGQVTDVTLVNSLRPDCDREAVRVMRLFNAWQPAIKDGQPVRQAITYAVPFYANTPIEATPRLQGGFWVTYHQDIRGTMVVGVSPDKLPDERITTITTPVDIMGHTIGDATVVKQGGRGSKERLTYLFSAVEVPATPKTTRAYQSSLTDNYCYMYGESLVKNEQGRILSASWYGDHGLENQRTFAENGLVEELREQQGDLIRVVSWYPNGQMKQVSYVNSRPKTTAVEPTLVTDYWDSTGKQTLRDGLGEIRWVERVKSRRDTAAYTQFSQQASYKQGLPSGSASGTYADGSYRYEETFDSGICRGGFAVLNGDTVRYTSVYQEPVFRDGLAAQEQFLHTVLRYPPKAQRLGINGHSWVNFTVRSTGELADYSLSHKLYPDLATEALRVVKASESCWQPALYRGEPVQATHKLLINFSLNQPFSARF